MNAYSKFKVVPFVTQSTLPEVSCTILKCQELFLDQLAPNHAYYIFFLEGQKLFLASDHFLPRQRVQVRSIKHLCKKHLVYSGIAHLGAKVPGHQWSQKLFGQCLH